MNRYLGVWMAEPVEPESLLAMMLIIAAQLGGLAVFHLAINIAPRKGDSHESQ